MRSDLVQVQFSGGRRLREVGAELVAVDARGWMLAGVEAGEAVERACRRLRAQVDCACVAVETVGGAS